LSIITLSFYNKSSVWWLPGLNNGDLTLNLVILLGLLIFESDESHLSNLLSKIVHLHWCHILGEILDPIIHLDNRVLIQLVCVIKLNLLDWELNLLIRHLNSLIVINWSGFDDSILNLPCGALSAYFERHWREWVSFF